MWYDSSPFRMLPNLFFPCIVFFFHMIYSGVFHLSSFLLKYRKISHSTNLTFPNLCEYDMDVCASFFKRLNSTSCHSKSLEIIMFWLFIQIDTNGLLVDCFYFIFFPSFSLALTQHLQPIEMRYRVTWQNGFKAVATTLGLLIFMHVSVC